MATRFMKFRFTKSLQERNNSWERWVPVFIIITTNTGLRAIVKIFLGFLHLL